MKTIGLRILGLIVFAAVVLVGPKFLRLAAEPPAPANVEPIARHNSQPYRAETATPNPPLLAQAASPASAAAKSSDPSPAPAQLWAAPIVTWGEKLDTKSAMYMKAQQQGVKLKGRSARFDPGSLVNFTALRRGDKVVIPLVGGEQVTGTINLVQQEASGWVRVGGELTGSGSGRFSLGSSGKKVGGTILLPLEEIAYAITEQADGQMLMEEKHLSEVICFPIPRLKDEPVPALRSWAPQEVPPILSSRPTATAVLYLDFDGETVTDPLWNSGNTIVAQPSSLSNSEITEVWNRIKEDYWHFNIDVTTDVSRYNNAAVGRRMRCIITPTCSWYNNCGAGGVAYLDCFDEAGQGPFSSTIPCWVFNTSVVGVAEAVSHELGHTLGLNHDGRTSPAEEYYQGHGTGAVGWAPIMGVGYYKLLVQWSKGEYLNANNQEDDIAIIANAANGFGFIADDAGNTRGSAAVLNMPGGSVNQIGIINGASDVDFYVFTVGVAQTVSINANPASISPNLDTLVELQDSAGTVLASSNPDTTLNAAISHSVAAGTYYIKVQGTGRGDVLGDGYSNYGSIGHYSLTGSINIVPVASFTASPTSGVAPLVVTFTDSSNGTITNRFWNFGNGTTSNTTATTVVKTYGSPGTNAVSLTVSGPGGSNTLTRVNYIVVTTPPPVANFSGSPTNGLAPLAVTFTDTSTGSITNRFWDFGDSSTTNVTTNSVAHTYAAGTYTVTLMASGPIGVSTNTKPNYITVLSSLSTINVEAANLQDGSGDLASTSSVVVLVADTGDNGFADPQPGFPLSVGAGWGADDKVVGLWDLRDAMTCSGNDGGALCGQTIVAYTNGIAAGQKLQLYWFPSLTLASGTIGVTSYGKYSDTNTPPLDGSDAWEIPASGSEVVLRFYTAYWGGSNPETAGRATLLTAAPTATVDIEAANLQDGSGDLASTSSVVVLVADMGDNGFADPQPGFPLSVSATWGADDKVVGLWDLRDAVSCSGNDGGALCGQTVVSYIGGIASGQKLQLYWFPSLTLASGTVGITSYGKYSDTNSPPLDGSDAWEIPASGSEVVLRFYTAYWGGSNPETAGRATLMTAGSSFAAWEQQYFGCTACPEAAEGADPDGDGQNNLAEFLAGTVPTNSASAFRITAVAHENNNLRVTWTLGSDKTNALQATAGAGNGSYSTNNFSDIFTVTNTVGSLTNYVDIGAATNTPARYYRVRLVP